MRIVIIAILCQCLFGSLVAESALRSSATTLSEDQSRELGTWLKKAKAWDRWNTQFRNKVSRDSVGRVKARKLRPSAPEWLQAECTGTPKDERDELLAQACALLDKFTGQAALDARYLELSDQRLQKDRPRHSSFMERIHADGPAGMMSSHSSVYGLLGMHMTLVGLGRIQMYGPPGLMLFRLPDDRAGRRYKFGYTWGVSVELFSFQFPGTTGDNRLVGNANITKAWLFGNAGSTLAMRGGMDFVGFSVSWRRTY